jgi:tetratricopeptide (TPR) repeat protein
MKKLKSYWDFVLTNIKNNIVKVIGAIVVSLIITIVGNVFGKPDIDVSKKIKEIVKNTSDKKSFDLATSYFDQQKYELAAKEFAISAELTNNDKSYFGWGTALDELGEYEEAIEKYDKAIQINPQNDNAYYHWGVILSKLGSDLEAQEKFDKADEIIAAHGNKI